MTGTSGDRSRFFPAIEQKHGGPISIWFDRLSELGEAKYPEQIAYLRENHGFSQTHANALVMHHRGSTTSKRFSTPDAYFASVDKAGAATAKRIFSAIRKTHPEFELVIAWNQPILRIDGKYVFGLSVSKNHITINPFSANAIADLGDKLAGLDAMKKTFKVPFDWKIDERLLREVVRLRLDEIA